MSTTIHYIIFLFIKFSKKKTKLPVFFFELLGIELALKSKNSKAHSRKELVTSILYKV